MFSRWRRIHFAFMGMSTRHNYSTSADDTDALFVGAGDRFDDDRRLVRKVASTPRWHYVRLGPGTSRPDPRTAVIAPAHTRRLRPGRPTCD
jgi:hypothetical protein